MQPICVCELPSGKRCWARVVYVYVRTHTHTYIYTFIHVCSGEGTCTGGWCLLNMCQAYTHTNTYTQIEGGCCKCNVAHYGERCECQIPQIHTYTHTYIYTEGGWCKCNVTHYGERCEYQIPKLVHGASKRFEVSPNGWTYFIWYTSRVNAGWTITYDGHGDPDFYVAKNRCGFDKLD